MSNDLLDEIQPKEGNTRKKGVLWFANGAFLLGSLAFLFIAGSLFHQDLPADDKLLAARALKFSTMVVSTLTVANPIMLIVNLFLCKVYARMKYWILWAFLIQMLSLSLVWTAVKTTVSFFGTAM